MKTTKHLFECLLKPWYLPRLQNTAKYVPTYLPTANISSYCQFEILYKPLKNTYFRARVLVLHWPANILRISLGKQF